MVSEPNIVLHQQRAFRTGLLYLFANLLVSVTAQLMLKRGMLAVGSYEAAAGASYLLQMIHPLVIGGLLLYVCGTVLWLMCLTKLELSFAYPVGTLQYLLVFVSAWWLFGEHISPLRIAGMAVICTGVIVMATQQKKR